VLYISDDTYFVFVGRCSHAHARVCPAIIIRRAALVTRAKPDVVCIGTLCCTAIIIIIITHTRLYSYRPSGPVWSEKTGAVYIIICVCPRCLHYIEVQVELPITLTYTQVCLWTFFQQRQSWTGCRALQSSPIFWKILIFVWHRVISPDISI